MLLQRIITAICLIIVLGAVLVASNHFYFILLCSLFSAAVMWEWLRLSGITKKTLRPVIVGIVFFVVLLLSGTHGSLQIATTLLNDEPFGRFSLFQFLLPFCLTASVIWLFIIPLVVVKAYTSTPKNGLLHSLFGFITITATCAVLILFQIQYGAWFILSYLILIWCADTFAYFGGRFFKGPKLAPAVSPGKTISGACSGILAAIVWMCLSALCFENSFAAILLQKTNWLVLIVAGLLLAVYSIIGDLYESLIKRRASFKDSSRLLPGHGGVWDRLDSVLAVTPIVYLIFNLVKF